MSEQDGELGREWDYEEYYYDGVTCPVCGDYTITIGGDDIEEQQQDVCENCGWRGDTYYP